MLNSQFRSLQTGGGVVRRMEDRREYDLSERSARFAEEILRFAKTVPKTPVTRPLWHEAKELNLIYARSFHTAGE